MQVGLPLRHRWANIFNNKGSWDNNHRDNTWIRFPPMQQMANQQTQPMPQPPQYFVDLWMGRIDKHGRKTSATEKLSPEELRKQQEADMARYMHFQKLAYATLVKQKYEQILQAATNIFYPPAPMDPVELEKYARRVQKERVAAPKNSLHSDKFPNNAQIRAIGREFMQANKDKKYHPCKKSTLGEFYKKFPIA